MRVCSQLIPFPSLPPTFFLQEDVDLGPLCADLHRFAPPPLKINYNKDIVKLQKNNMTVTELVDQEELVLSEEVEGVANGGIEMDLEQRKLKESQKSKEKEEKEKENEEKASAENTNKIKEEKPTRKKRKSSDNE